jgi:hypothetical protein
MIGSKAPNEAPEDFQDSQTRNSTATPGDLENSLKETVKSGHRWAAAAGSKEFAVVGRGWLAPGRFSN